MSWMVSRILLTILLFPSATLLLFMSFIFIERLILRDEDDAFPVAALLTAIYMVLYWLAVWRGAVFWTRRRVRLTWESAAAAAVIGIALGAAIAMVWPYSEGLAALFGSLSAAVLWIIGTICIWRES